MITPMTRRFVVERVTRIEPGLSAWELACHILPTIVNAAQRLFSLSVGARYRPSQTAQSGTQGARLLTLPPTGGRAGLRRLSPPRRVLRLDDVPGTGRQGGSTEGGAHPVDLAMHATAARPNTHANTTGYGVIAQAAEQQLR